MKVGNRDEIGWGGLRSNSLMNDISISREA
jgi:hypothetical protein